MGAKERKRKEYIDIRMHIYIEIQKRDKRIYIQIYKIPLGAKNKRKEKYLYIDIYKRE